MEQIYETNKKFPFDDLMLSKPTTISGGSFFIKFSVNGSPLYIQPPKCNIKHPSQKGSKRTHCDFVFSQENDEFIQWMEDLENRTQQKIFQNKETWFETSLEMEDIENSFVSPMKSYKSGKYYIVRTNLPNRLGKMVLKIYDEDENDILLENIDETGNVMTILEIQGIRCSARSFQIDIELKQMMVLRPVNIFEKCVFKTSGNINIVKSKSLPSGPLITDDTNTEGPDTNTEGPDTNTEGPNTNTEGPDTNTEEPDTNTEGPDTNTEGPTFSDSFIEESSPVILNNEIESLDLITKISNETIEIPTDELCEVEFNLEELQENDTFNIKDRKDVYYEMYREARKKAKLAKDLAMSAYLEADRIKNTYMLDDIDDSDDSDIDFDDDTDETDEM